MHDLLALLAEKNAGDEQEEASLEIRGFLGWQEGYVGAKVEDLTPINRKATA